MENPTLENPMQLNKEIQKTNLSIKEKSNIDLSNTDSLQIHSLKPLPYKKNKAAALPGKKRTEEADAYKIYEEIIKDNISYDILLQDKHMDKDRLNEIVDLMLETICSARKQIRIAGDDYPAELVKAKFIRQIKKGNADLKRFVKAIYYLKDNNLRTIADLQGKISTLQSQNKKISQEIKAKTTRIENLNKCFVYADIIKDNKQIFEEWNSKSLFKDSFYNSHKEQIYKYKREMAIIEKITGSSAIKSKDWQKEIDSLEDEITKLNNKSQSIKEEYESINHIKYAVKTVNDDYGIDLSIEIDKAIKRGEKPSVIAQLKKYQEQGAKYEQRKEKTKDYYRNEER